MFVTGTFVAIYHSKNDNSPDDVVPVRCNGPLLPHPWPLPTSIVWTSCPVASVDVQAAVSGSSATSSVVQAQCLTVNVPMSWNQSAPGCLYHQTISVFVKRVFLGDPLRPDATQVREAYHLFSTAPSQYFSSPCH